MSRVLFGSLGPWVPMSHSWVALLQCEENCKDVIDNNNNYKTLDKLYYIDDTRDKRGV